MEQELITLGILFFFALIGGILASKFKQPILLGLLMIGAVIGPKALGIIKSENALELMIEFGAILMLFVIGLEFDISKLQKIGLKAVIIATLNSALLTFVGFVVCMLIGFNVQASLFIGVILAFGSTVIIVKVLENKGLMERQEVPLLIAVLIIEDILAVLVITFFSGMIDKSTGLMGNIETLIISMIILVVAYLAFVKAIKPLLAWVMKDNTSEEITTFMALALCAGFAYLAYILKLSPAVGAFLAGSIVASLPNSKEFEKAISPYNLIISSFFFIAIGTLIDFAAIREHIMIILILVAVVIITKIIAFSGLVYFFANMRGDRMFFSSIAMFSIGEFSLLVAKESAQFNVGIDLVSISAAIVTISAILMSILISHSDKIYEPTMENMPYRIRKKMESIAAYVKSISEELDLDNRHSKGLKNNVLGMLGGMLFLLLAIFGWRRLVSILIVENVSSVVVNLGLILTQGIIAIGLFYVLFRMKRVMRSFSDILANAVNTRNAIQSRKIVTRAFIIFGTCATMLIFPFIMFMFNLGKVYLFVPLGLALTMIYHTYRLSEATKEETQEYYGSSKKFEYHVKNSFRV